MKIILEEEIIILKKAFFFLQNFIFTSFYFKKEICYGKELMVK
jgi:hypothetical protein